MQKWRKLTADEIFLWWILFVKAPQQATKLSKKEEISRHSLHPWAKFIHQLHCVPDLDGPHERVRRTAADSWRRAKGNPALRNLLETSIPSAQEGPNHSQSYIYHHPLPSRTPSRSTLSGTTPALPKKDHPFMPKATRKNSLDKSGQSQRCSSQPTFLSDSRAILEAGGFNGHSSNIISYTDTTTTAHLKNEGIQCQPNTKCHAEWRYQLKWWPIFDRFLLHVSSFMTMKCQKSFFLPPAHFHWSRKFCFALSFKI